jgi:hypothetical protein
VAHACNPSYSGGRDQEDHSSKPALGKQFSRPYLEKNPSYKRTDEVSPAVSMPDWQHEALSSNPSAAKKKKKFRDKT